MAQYPDEMSDTQQPPQAPGGLNNLASFNVSSTPRPNMTVDSNNLYYSSPNHAKASQNLDVSSAATTAIDPMLPQQFDNRLDDENHSNDMIPTGYSQFSGMMPTGWDILQPMHPGVGGSLEYDAYNMDPMGPGGLGQLHTSTAPIMATTNPQEQQGQRGNSAANRWTPRMDERLLSLIDDGETRRSIAQTLETEFPSAMGLKQLNDNIITKRLGHLRKNAAAPTKIEKCINRCIPRMLPVLENEVARLFMEEGYKPSENDKAELEHWMRTEMPKGVQKLILERKKAHTTGRGQSAPQARAKVTKPTRRRARAPNANSGDSQSDNASASTGTTAPTAFGPATNRD
ncbi:hypothetical protein QBC45DRAFT_244510 [Copromyces sp. CBS 386.78]|nr:hypothetical protein QBC45DRAFT_244510 [Copromyces sp. CBS 386.78]